MSNAAATRVFIIGLDGADWSLLRPLFEDGAMPALSAFVKAGASATLESVLPTNSMSAWTSFMTGVNPGKHGMFDFVRRTETPFQTDLTNSSSIRAETVWETLTRRGLSSCVIDMPPLYPPFEINGVMMGGMGAAAGVKRNYSWPSDAAAKVEGAIGEFLPDVAWLGKGRSQSDLLAELIAHVENRRRATEFLLTDRPWDVFCSVFVAPDRIQHVFWRDLTERGPGYPEARRFYAALDAALASVLDRIDLTNTDVLIVSDHGFRSAERTFDVNQFLVEGGFVQGRRAYSAAAWGLRSLGARIPIPKSVALPLIDAQWKLQRRILQGSVAYSDTTDGVCVNLAGRQPAGVVAPSDYDDVRRTVAARLLEFRDPETGTPVVRNVVKREDYFRGEYAGEAPDLILELHDGYAYVGRTGKVVHKWMRGEGVHSRQGIIAGLGPHIRRSTAAAPVSIMDVAPTVLSLLGVPVPEDCDGRIAEGLLAGPPSPAGKGPAQASERPPVPARQPSAYTADEEAVVKERLRGLGYID